MPGISSRDAGRFRWVDPSIPPSIPQEEGGPSQPANPQSRYRQLGFDFEDIANMIGDFMESQYNTWAPVFDRFAEKLNNSDWVNRLPVRARGQVLDAKLPPLLAIKPAQRTNGHSYPIGEMLVTDSRHNSIFEALSVNRCYRFRADMRVSQGPLAETNYGNYMCWKDSKLVPPDYIRARIKEALQSIRGDFGFKELYAMVLKEAHGSSNYQKYPNFWMYQVYGFPGLRAKATIENPQLAELLRVVTSVL